MARLRNLEETFQNEIGFAPSCRCYLEDDIEEEKMREETKKEVVYKINEIFESIQGEGLHTGEPVIFIRLAGCSMGCEWCDTKSCQEVDCQLTAKKIVDYLKFNFVRKNVVITGGEPFEQDLEQLVDTLKQSEFQIYIETNGAHYISDYIRQMAWITVSPKAYYKDENLNKANEIKLVISDELDIKKAKRMISYHSYVPFYLQPESQNEKSTELCVKTCLEDPRFKLSVQVHKFINVR